jgi:hypothetical protein
MLRCACLAVALALVLAGCSGKDGPRAANHTPYVERGACATVIMPGQTVPMGSQPECAGGHASLGGETVIETQEEALGSKFPGQKVLAAPFAILAYPLKKADQAIVGVEKAARDRKKQKAYEEYVKRHGGRVDPQEQWEDQQLLAIEEQLGNRKEELIGEPLQQPTARATPPPPPAPQRAGASSFADEVARLRGEAAQSAPPAPDPGLGDDDALQREVAPAPAPAAEPSLPPVGAADRMEDTDGDGQPDHWLFREGETPVRELFDENGDGRPDRIVHFDAATGREARVEEDRNHDGRIDSWAEYQAGALARQRRDSDYDGTPDAWVFYRQGEIARQETDSDGDGFRNRVSLYDGGRLAKERDDLDGDGRVDVVTVYDAEERVQQRDADKNGDGLVDERSFYSAGKLVRRELVTDPERIDDGDDDDSPRAAAPGGPDAS